MTLRGIESQWEQAIREEYNSLLKQLAGRLEVIDKDNRQPHVLMEQVRQTVEAAAKSGALPVQEHHHTYTLDVKSSKTVLVMSVMAVTIVLLAGFIYQVSVSNQQLTANDLKYCYVKMCGGIKETELTELEATSWAEQHKAIFLGMVPKMLVLWSLCHPHHYCNRKQKGADIVSRVYINHQWPRPWFQQMLLRNPNRGKYQY